MNDYFFTTKEEIKDWLNKLEITKYTIRDDLTVDVFETISLAYLYCKDYIPVQFGIIEGDFNCSYCELTTLKGCPDIVKGNFNCRRNSLTTLKYFPQYIDGNIDCSGNDLTSLKGVPEIINGTFCCSFNQLTNLIEGPKIVKGDFNCSVNKLITLEGCPEIGKTFYLNHNKLTSLKYCPKNIKENLVCHYNNINTFQSFPDNVVGVLDIHENNIVENECVNFNTYVQNSILSDFGDKTEFLKIVNKLKILKENNELNKIIVSEKSPETNKHRL